MFSFSRLQVNPVPSGGVQNSCRRFSAGLNMSPSYTLSRGENVSGFQEFPFGLSLAYRPSCQSSFQWQNDINYWQPQHTYATGPTSSVEGISHGSSLLSSIRTQLWGPLHTHFGIQGGIAHTDYYFRTIHGRGGRYPIDSPILTSLGASLGLTLSVNNATSVNGGFFTLSVMMKHIWTPLGDFNIVSLLMRGGVLF